MRMTKVVMVMMLAVSAGLPTMAEAQSEPQTAVVSLPEDAPQMDWEAMARVFSGWHGKVTVATVAKPEKLVPCTVKELTAKGVTCKGKFGKSVVYGREQIAEVSTPKESKFDWGDLVGLGFLGALGGGAGLGTAVMCGIGGAALLAAAPLALVAAVAGGTFLVLTSYLVDTTPGRVLYQKPEKKSAEKPAASAVDGPVGAS